MCCSRGLFFVLFGVMVDCGGVRNAAPFGSLKSADNGAAGRLGYRQDTRTSLTQYVLWYRSSLRLSASLYSSSGELLCRRRPSDSKRTGKPLTIVHEGWAAARGTIGGLRLALTLYASGLGSWILFATPETGVLAGLWGLVGYGLGNAMPAWCVIWAGPRVLETLGNRGFSMTDFVLVRFGRHSQVFAGFLAVFYNMIFISAELSGMSDTLAILVPGYPAWLPPLLIATFTLAYSLMGGIRASYLTDFIQAPLMLALTIGACEHYSGQ